MISTYEPPHGPPSLSAPSVRWDCQEQVRLILLHRIRLCRALGRDVCPNDAASDWAEKHAASWREWRERQIDGAFRG